MTQTLPARDEPRTEGGDHGSMVEHRAVKHLQRGTGRVVERNDLFDAAGVGPRLWQLLERDAGGVQCGLDPFMLSAAADFLCGSVVFVDGGSDAYFRANEWPRSLSALRLPRYLW